jgi:hypothetical protein
MESRLQSLQRKLMQKRQSLFKAIGMILFRVVAINSQVPWIPFRKSKWKVFEHLMQELQLVGLRMYYFAVAPEK